jgi:hypothetical protein
MIRSRCLREFHLGVAVIAFRGNEFASLTAVVDAAGNRVYHAHRSETRHEPFSFDKPQGKA